MINIKKRVWNWPWPVSGNISVFAKRHSSKSSVRISGVPGENRAGSLMNTSYVLLLQRTKTEEGTEVYLHFPKHLNFVILN